MFPRYRQVNLRFPALLRSGLAAGALLGGCKPATTTPSTPAPVAASSEIVATVEDRPITQARLEETLRRRGPGADPADALADLIQLEATVVRARAAGLDRDPELLAAWDRMLASRFEELELNEVGASDATPSEAQIAAYYRDHPQRFSTAPQARGAVILLRCSPRATDEARAAVARRAAALLEEARATDLAGFARLAQQHSEEQASRYNGGDTGWLRRDPAFSGREPALIAALFEIPTPGALAPVVETPSGYYVVRLKERKPGGVRPLDEVRETIRHELARDAARARKAKFHARVKEGLSIDINQALLQGMRTTNVGEVAPPPLPPGPR